MARKLTRAQAAALDHAQERLYDAYEAKTAKRRIALAEEALRISPLCADAHSLLAEHAEPGSEAELGFWRAALQAGEASLGPMFEEVAGEFWGWHETRPYMRARLGLAMALWRRGSRTEAVDHLVDMLRLNPNDNQGVRYILAGFLCQLNRHDDLDRLADRYPDDDAAAWTWTLALAEFRRSGDGDASREKLAAALASNEHVPAYLLGKARIPKRLPPFYSPGEKDEAVLYAAEQAPAWAETEGAREWLRSFLKMTAPSGKTGG